MRGLIRRLTCLLILLGVLFGVALYSPCHAPNEAVPASANAELCGSFSIGSRFWELISGDDRTLPIGSAALQSDGRVYLIPGGTVFGTRLREGHLVVASPDDGHVLLEGDKLLSIDGREILSIEDVKDVLRSSSGGELTVKVMRGGKSITLKLSPKDVGGEYKLGATLREGAAGIGTITYINPATGEFGGLGHGICDPDTGKVTEMISGTVTGVVLGGVVKGASGAPGELSGILTDKCTGEIYANTECGVFGVLSVMPKKLGEPIPCAHKSEVQEGEAKIISTLKNGATMEYKVELLDINHSSSGTKSFKIRVVDKALTAISGGIVRGMSGSPIIQNGKLVGAVTHVMVADPTEGYGIFIENMLNASNARNELPKAA